MDKLFLNELDKIIDGKTTVIPSAENDSEKYILELSRRPLLKSIWIMAGAASCNNCSFSVVVLVVPLCCAFFGM